MPPLSAFTRTLPTQAAVVVAIAAIALLAGCAPDPDPTPTPTPAFASEEAAFAAAEATFANYIQALSRIDTSRPETFEDLFGLSTGSVESADRRNFAAMHADGRLVDGDTRVLSFRGVESHAPFSTVAAAVCLDVTEVTITNPDGSSAVNPDRPDVYALKVLFHAPRDGGLLIESASPTEDFSCPDS